MEEERSKIQKNILKCTEAGLALRRRLTMELELKEVYENFANSNLEEEAKLRLWKVVDETLRENQIEFEDIKNMLPPTNLSAVKVLANVVENYQKKKKLKLEEEEDGDDDNKINEDYGEYEKTSYSNTLIEIDPEQIPIRIKHLILTMKEYVPMEYQGDYYIYIYKHRIKVNSYRLVYYNKVNNRYLHDSRKLGTWLRESKEF
jgi:hypothetical protein